MCKVFARRCAFNPKKLFDHHRPFRPSPGFGHATQYTIGQFARIAPQQCPSITNFARNKSLRQSKIHAWIRGELKLTATQLDVLVRRWCSNCRQPSTVRKMHHSNVARSQFAQRLRGELHIAEKVELCRIQQPRLIDDLALVAYLQCFTFESDAVSLPLHVNGQPVIACCYEPARLARTAR